MFSVVYAAAVVMALLAQTSPLLFTVGPGLRVDLTLVVVVYVSLFWGGERALLAGFLTGLGQDTLSSDVLGLHAFSKSLTAFVVHTLSRHVQSQSLIAQVVFACLAVLIDTLAHLVVMVVFQLPMLPGAVVFSTFVQQTCLSMLIAPCVCYTLQRAMHYGRVRQDKG
ncbi:MAG: rod shape-determining protein MreD [Candidatus Tectomicrobia bacterium]|uniref:Rod shape-determining protein MreD n=1 Tax=Tectimicrobiota bacterium TaxID=2528274 RepID=A0A938B0Z0_UNCTE|nr:rod shape-determining protein MreD [Candidatus Tectomicrobia bacterium]